MKYYKVYTLLSKKREDTIIEIHGIVKETNDFVYFESGRKAYKQTSQLKYCKTNEEAINHLKTFLCKKIASISTHILQLEEKRNLIIQRVNRIDQRQ